MRRWPPQSKVVWSGVSFGKLSSGFLHKDSVGRRTHADDRGITQGKQRQAPVKPQWRDRTQDGRARLPSQGPQALNQVERAQALRNGGARRCRTGSTEDIEKDGNQSGRKSGRRDKEDTARKGGPVGIRLPPPRERSPAL